MELEHKFLLHGADCLQNALLAARTLGWSVGEKADCAMEDEYWDDAQKTAQKSMVSMRLRTCEGKTLYTEKRAISQKDGRFVREETEVELGTGTLPAALQAAGRVPVLRVEHLRSLYPLTLGRTAVEFAYEAVFYIRNGERIGPEYQLELELKSPAGGGKLETLATAIKGLEGFAPMSESKFQRGMALTEYS